MIKRTVLAFLRAYQRLSRVLATYQIPFLWYSGCRFHPTCSEYCYDAIVKHGLWEGIIKGGWRIMRCNPFSQGGVDLA